MKANIKKLWLEALRSDKYLQGRGALHTTNSNGDDAFCCYGVLCDLAKKSKVMLSIRSGDTLVYYDDSKWLIPDKVRKWAGLDSNDPTVVDEEGDNVTLSSCNDEGMNFTKISKLIEDQL